MSNYEDEPSFSLNDFKKWMQGQDDKDYKPQCSLFGVHIESKLGFKRLIERMQIEEGDLKEVAREFRKHGGIILESDRENILLVEVDSGSFKIPKYFVRKVKN